MGRGESGFGALRELRIQSHGLANGEPGRSRGLVLSGEFLLQWFDELGNFKVSYLNLWTLRL